MAVMMVLLLMMILLLLSLLLLLVLLMMMMALRSALGLLGPSVGDGGRGRPPEGCAGHAPLLPGTPRLRAPASSAIS
eukprot:1142985-Pyramimonas_sp.AAC.1